MTTPDVRARRIGKEGEPVIVIDHFVPDPHALRVFAATQDYGPAGRHYPGIAASLPDSYMRDQGALIATIAKQVFGMSAGLSLLEARFSIVTMAPSALSIEQRLPHVDAVEPGRLALIHYSCPTKPAVPRSTGIVRPGSRRSTPVAAILISPRLTGIW